MDNSSNDPIGSTTPAVGENFIEYFMGGVALIKDLLNGSVPPQTMCQKYQNVLPISIWIPQSIAINLELILVTDTGDERPIPKKYYICIFYILYELFFFFN